MFETFFCKNFLWTKYIPFSYSVDLLASVPKIGLFSNNSDTLSIFVGLSQTRKRNTEINGVKYRVAAQIKKSNMIFKNQTMLCNIVKRILVDLVLCCGAGGLEQEQRNRVPPFQFKAKRKFKVYLLKHRYLV